MNFLPCYLCINLVINACHAAGRHDYSYVLTVNIRGSDRRGNAQAKKIPMEGNFWIYFFYAWDQYPFMGTFWVALFFSVNRTLQSVIYVKQVIRNMFVVMEILYWIFCSFLESIMELSMLIHLSWVFSKMERR